MTTVVDSSSVHPPESVTVNVYRPASAAVALTMLGFCRFDEKPFGPVQL